MGGHAKVPLEPRKGVLGSRGRARLAVLLPRPFVEGGAEAGPKEPTGKAERRWGGGTEVSGVKEEDGGKGLEMRAGQRGGVRQRKEGSDGRERGQEGGGKLGAGEPLSLCLYSAWHHPRESAQGIRCGLSTPL